MDSLINTLCITFFYIEFKFRNNGAETVLIPHRLIILHLTVLQDTLTARLRKINNNNIYF